MCPEIVPARYRRPALIKVQTDSEFNRCEPKTPQLSRHPALFEPALRARLHGERTIAVLLPHLYLKSSLNAGSLPLTVRTWVTPLALRLSLSFAASCNRENQVHPSRRGVRYIHQTEHLELANGN